MAEVTTEGPVPGDATMTRRCGCLARNDDDQAGDQP